MIDLIQQGVVNPAIANVYSLSEVKQGHLEREGRRTIGKSIIKIC